MRIENNNNVNFGAYFKENANLKKVYNASVYGSNNNLVDKFVKECPNHEVEILDITKKAKGWTSTIFNNTSKNLQTIDSTRHPDLILYTILEKLTDKNSSESKSFWNENTFKDTYNKLTNKK